MSTLIFDAVVNPESVVAPDSEPDPHNAGLLTLTATAAIATYGGAIHASDGLFEFGRGALSAVLAAGGAWILAVPSLVIVGALLGSSLSWRRTVYATLVSVNFGGLCFLASIPIIALMEATWAMPGWDPRLLINLLVVTGIGFSSVLVFMRTMAAMEAPRLLHFVWISLFGALFIEFAVLGGLTHFL